MSPPQQQIPSDNQTGPVIYGREGPSQNTVNTSSNMEYSSGEVWPEVSFMKISNINCKALKMCFLDCCIVLKFLNLVASRHFGMSISRFVVQNEASF